LALVLIAQNGQVGHITLNRPEALNALTLEMVRDIAGALSDWREDPAIQIIIVDSANKKAFCAGGDIRAISASGKARDGQAQTFWREEYQLNSQIAHFGKPIVTLMDGITMGGGVGIGAHASHRVVTDATVMAMPEVSIGFVPDVGSTWLLSRAPGAFGMFAALTARRLSAADAIACDLADAYIPGRILPSFIQALNAFDFSAGSTAGASTLLYRFASPTQPGFFQAHREWIDRAFGKESIEEIVSELTNCDGSEPKQAVVEMLKHSPKSLKLARRALDEAKGDRTLEDSLRREFRVACRSLENPDFHEGIRAAVIDKDQSPKWTPPELSGVDSTSLEQFFAPLGADELRLDSDKRRVETVKKKSV
jgi:enoyl-CoA hydratase